MSEPVKYTIVDFRMSPSLKSDRRGQMDAFITYDMQGGIRDTISIPGEDVTLEKARVAVEEAIRFKMQFIGSTGEVPR